VFGAFTVKTSDWPEVMGNTYAIAIYVKGSIPEDNDYASKNTFIM